MTHAPARLCFILDASQYQRSFTPPHPHPAPPHSSPLRSYSLGLIVVDAFMSLAAEDASNMDTMALFDATAFVDFESAFDLALKGLTAALGRRATLSAFVPEEGSPSPRDALPLSGLPQGRSPATSSLEDAHSIRR